MSATPTVVDETIRLLQFLLQHAGGHINMHVKLDLPELGSVELALGGQAMPSPVQSTDLAQRLEPAFEFQTETLARPTPDNPVAAKIIATCDDVYDDNKGDCNQFLKAAAMPYFGDIFNGLNADGIIAKLKVRANGWTMTNTIPDAINNAKNGAFVIAGMTSTELGQKHGHLAVVVGYPGEASGNVIVPIAYAGSIDGPNVQIRAARLSGTFNRVLVHESKISYFSKIPTQ